MLPGTLPLHDHSNRQSFEDTWGWPVSMNRGKTLMEFMEDSLDKKIKAMYIMGGNPAFSLPDSGRMAEALEKVDFLVVQDMFLTETAERADVVLPSMGWPQKNGTYVNTERRIQTLKSAIKHKGKEDWRMLMEVGNRAGLKLKYNSEKDIMAEIAATVPLYRDLEYSDIEKGIDLWPYRGKPSPDTFFEPSDEIFLKFPLTQRQEVFIMLDKPLHLKGTVSRHSPALQSVNPEPVARIHPATADRLGFAEGDTAEISTHTGSLVLKIKLDTDVPENVIFLTNSFRDNGIFKLLGYNKEPLTGAPVLQYPEATIKKVE